MLGLREGKCNRIVNRAMPCARDPSLRLKGGSARDDASPTETTKQSAPWRESLMSSALILDGRCHPSGPSTRRCGSNCLLRSSGAAALRFAACGRNRSRSVAAILCIESAGGPELRGLARQSCSAQRSIVLKTAEQELSGVLDKCWARRCAREAVTAQFGVGHYFGNADGSARAFFHVASSAGIERRWLLVQEREDSRI